MRAKYYSKVSYLGLATMLGLTLTAPHADAGGFRIVNQNAFATGRGNAFTATADDASAVYYNAAGLTQLDRRETQLGLYLVDFKVNHRDGGGVSRTDNPIQAVPQFFYSRPMGDYSFGLGFYAPFGLGNDWGNNTPFSTVTTDAELRYLTLNPVVARELSPTLSVGAGLHINFADANIAQAVGVFAGDEIRFRGDDSAVGVNLAVHWRPSSRHYWGATYRSAVTHQLKGDARVSFLPDATDASFSLDIPDLLTVGYSFRPNDEWNLETNIEWAGWGRLDTPMLQNTPLGSFPYAFEWKDSLMLKLGATKRIDRYSLSVGYDWSESAQPDQTFNPAVPDADRHWFHVGVAVREGARPWAIAYQMGTSDRTVNGANLSMAGETPDGRYEARIHSLSLTVGFRAP